MRTTTGFIYSNPSQQNPQPYSPSVPLYVYRELAAELQATQKRLDALANNHQQLLQENQQLRQEISKVVQSFLHLQKLVDSQTIPSYQQIPYVDSGTKTTATPPVTEARPRASASRSRQPVVPEAASSKSRHPEFYVPVEQINSPIPKTVFIEEEEVSYYPAKKSEVKEFSGWWLAFTIFLIMLSAFGTGYLIVRPLFEHQRR